MLVNDSLFSYRFNSFLFSYRFILYFDYCSLTGVDSVSLQVTSLSLIEFIEGVVAPWCNPLTLQPEQSGGMGSNPGRATPLERHDKGSRTRLGQLYFCDPSAWR